MPSGKKQVNPQQETFVREYVVCGNATAAAIKAGYSPQTATNQAYKLLTLPKIQALILSIKQPLDNNAIASRDERLTVLSDLVRGKLGATNGERISAANLMSKMLGEQIIHNRISGPTGGPIEIETLQITELIKLLKEAQ